MVHPGMPRRIYLDYAATAAQRPPAVVDAVAGYLTGNGSTPGRGGHSLAIEAGRMVLRCRQRLARRFGIAGDAGRIALLFSATHALNTALHGMLHTGDVLVVTQLDHNAVLRPAFALARDRGVVLRMVRALPDGTLDATDLERALDGARLLVLNGASNVLGTVLPLAPLAALARAAGANVLVDAAQLAGHERIDVERDGIDLLAFTGHKALLGPHGTGGLWVRPGLHIEPLLLGGTGGDSLSREMPPAFPDHLEAGTMNAPGVAGLEAALLWAESHDEAAAAQQARMLKARLYDGLAGIRGIRVVSPRADNAVPIVTCVATAIDAATLAGRLDREHGVLVRPGLHCAPETHALLGTDRSGAVRFSAGWATTEEEIDQALDAVASIVGSATG
jgi:cysteine desulfurase / selenocysteine lyase